jgi:hypothetical protein
MRLIMLPGAGKTGSTFIQNVFAKNRDKLRQIGVSYPLEDITSEAGNGEFIWYYLSYPNYDNLRSYFRIAVSEAKASGCHTIIISCEMIIDLSTIDHETLKVVINEFFDESNYFIFLRNPVDWVVSAWLQAVKRGSYLSFEEYYPTFAAGQLSCALRFSKVFSDSQFFSYDKYRNDLVINVFRILGLGTQEFYHLLDCQNIERNRSLTAREVEVSLIFNKLWSEQELRKKFNEFLRVHNENDQSESFSISMEMRADIARINAPYIHLFEEKYGFLLENC